MMAYSLGDVVAVATVIAGPMSPPRTVPFSAILMVNFDLMFHITANLGQSLPRYTRSEF